MARSNRGEHTRKKILEAALRLFSQRGYFSTSTRDLLDAVSLTKGAFYYYFKSKAALVSSLVQEARYEVEHEVIDPARSQARPDALFRLALEQVVRLNQKGIWLYGSFLSRLMQEALLQNGSWCDSVREMIRWLLEFWRETIEEGQRSGSIRQDLNSRILAEMAFGMMIAGAGMREIVPDSPSVEQKAVFLLRIASS